MKKIYHLSSCSTCQRIIKEINPDNSVDLQDIKVQNIDASMLDWIKDKVGSYEALFSKRAMKFRAMGLHEQQLTDDDYRRLMLEEYTFLKRPFILLGEQVFIGNAKKDVEAAVKAFHS
jgi:arsenate reductase-like glutaredoxin family protein